MTDPSCSYLPAFSSHRQRCLLPPRPPSCRHAIADSDLEAAIKAQEWPRRLTDLLAEASRRAANEHKSYEAALKARRKELGELVEALAGQVEGLEQRGELVKRDVLAAEVRGQAGFDVSMCSAALGV